MGCKMRISSIEYIYEKNIRFANIVILDMCSSTETKKVRFYKEPASVFG